MTVEKMVLCSCAWQSGFLHRAPSSTLHTTSAWYLCSKDRSTVTEHCTKPLLWDLCFLWLWACLSPLKICATPTFVTQFCVPDLGCLVTDPDVNPIANYLHRVFLCVSCGASIYGRRPTWATFELHFHLCKLRRPHFDNCLTTFAAFGAILYNTTS